MELQGTNFGKIAYEEGDLLTIPAGLVGLPRLTRFLILDFEEKVVFKWLQSVDDPAMGWLVAPPQLFRTDYALALLPEETAALAADSPADLAVFVICTYAGDLREITGNLLGPVVVNAGRRLGRQVIIDRSEFSTHEKLNILPPGPKLKRAQEHAVENCA